MEHHATVGDRTIHYLDAGQGRPVVLIHGFPLAARLWRPQLLAVPAGWRVIAPDLRGFGRSAPGAGGVAGSPARAPALSMDDHASDVVALLDALEIDRAVVGGLSMGGYITFALWRRAQERVRAMVLADTRAEADTPEARAGREKMLAQLDEQGPAGVAAAMLPKLLGPSTRRDRPDLVAEVTRVIEGTGRDAIADAIRCLISRPDSMPLLPAITVPVHLLVGRDDELTPVALHETMRAALPDASLTIIEHAGHLSNLEQPGAFNRSLERFLKGLP